ncbi:MAG: delta-60 repeat domain-containing protein [Planctomycetes bacterium]|nr:delta-60 repeat domain-containing protein [Planctomycetota bacterium]
MLLTALVLLTTAAPSPGQCAPEWLADTSFGTDGRVTDLQPWDPDGPGPLAPRLVGAGHFATAGNVVTNQVATYDPSTRTWATLGDLPPVLGGSPKITTLANGSLVLATNRSVLQWNGTSWTTLGTANAIVNEIIAMPNGDLVIGGDFFSVSGVPARKVARWNGSTWSALGSGLETQPYALVALPGGDLVAGGYFTTAGGNPANRVARWNGTTWSALGPGLGTPGTYLNAYVLDMAVLPGGDVVAVGRFASAGATAVSNVARWDGTTWHAVGTGTNDTVEDVAVIGDNHLLVGGHFTAAGGAPASRVARWTGSAWSAIEGGVDDYVSAVATMPGGSTYFGGNFTTANGMPAARLASYTPAWSLFPTGLTPPSVRAVVHMANGDVVVGGGEVPGGVARTDGVAWYSLGGGVSHFFATQVSDLLELPGGDLVVTGTFNNAGGATIHNIARWNGSTWASFGSGTNGEVNAVVRMPNGDLVAGGLFTMAGGLPVNRIARWDGSAWSALGAGVNGNVYALAVAPDGSLVAGGSFTTAGGSAADRVARWNGAFWAPVGGGLVGSSGSVFSLLHLQDGSLLVGGSFTTANGAPGNGIVRFTSSWQPLGVGVVGTVFGLEQLASGAIVVAGSLTGAGGVPTQRLARYEVSTWVPVVPGTNGSVSALAKAPDGETLVLGGSFTQAGGLPANAVARLRSRGEGWSAVTTGLGSLAAPVTALTMRGNGHIVAAMTPSSSRPHLTTWNGQSWSQPHSGSDGFILDLLELASGDLVAVGNFTRISGQSVFGIARWDGQAWHALGNGLRDTSGGRALVYCLAALPNGNLVAGGNFASAGGVITSNVARWDGQAWHAMSIGNSSDTVRDLAVMPNGDLIAAGVFMSSSGVQLGGVARWIGSSWSSLGTGMSSPSASSREVNALVVMPDGTLVATGPFTSAGGTPANGIARWNGTAWSSLGSGLNGYGTALEVLPNGDLVVSGVFSTAGGVHTSGGIARWNGTAWSAVNHQVQGGTVNRLLAGRDGLLFAGSFTTTGPRGNHVHQLGSTCPATVTHYGTGCVGAGGLNQLTELSLPWLGASFRSRATGMPPLALVFSIYGFAQLSLPISVVLPQGLPGCVFWSDSALYTLRASTASTLDSAVHLPVGVSLPGQVFHHFVLTFELDANANVVAVSSTNALRATIGTY